MGSAVLGGDQYSGRSDHAARLGYHRSRTVSGIIGCRGYGRNSGRAIRQHHVVGKSTCRKSAYRSPVYREIAKGVIRTSYIQIEKVYSATRKNCRLRYRGANIELNSVTGNTTYTRRVRWVLRRDIKQRQGVMAVLTIDIYRR